MQYIEQSLAENEELVRVARFHWMYNVQAVFNVVFGIVFAILIIVFAIDFQPLFFNAPGFENLGWLDQVRALHPGVKIVSFFVLLMGVLRFAQMMIIKSTTEIAVTNKRLVYKRGLVARYVGEMNIDRIEGINVMQGVLGRIFGYGRVMVRGMGVGEVVLPPIESPIAFRKSIEKARDKYRERNGPNQD